MKYQIMYLSKNLHTFGLLNTQLCSFCKIKEDTISHLFYYCFTDCLHFSHLTPQTPIFVFHNFDNDTCLI